MSSEVKVGIVTSNEGDFAAMTPAVDLLNEFGVPHEIVAIDPYGEPQHVVQYAERALERGLRFILAGTGEAPALPAMLASHTIVPVVGVPLSTSILGGGSPQFSLVHMLDRVPVATVGLGDARSAALTAVKALALGDDALRAKLRNFVDRQQQTSAPANDEE